MKISIVTLSFNQAPFLEQALRSVLDQDYPDLEYIVVDPGSTDGSRDLLERYGPRINRLILEPDQGPADGLNKGFSQASGTIYGFLNADDALLPGALNRVASAFSETPGKDVISGHTLIVDATGRSINRFYSRRFSLHGYVHEAAFLAQPATFFRADAFKRTSGFNLHNRVAWDGELWVDLALAGARFGLIPDFLSAFRLYENSITGSGRMDVAYRAHMAEMFQKIMGRPFRRADRLTALALKAAQYIGQPRIVLDRLRYGAPFPAR